MHVAASSAIGCVAARAGDHVLALGVGQEVALELVLAGGDVAGGGDAGAGVLAEVAEHHGDDVHRGAEVVRNARGVAVVDARACRSTSGTRPRSPARAARSGSCGKGLARLRSHDALELRVSAFEIFARAGPRRCVTPRARAASGSSASNGSSRYAEHHRAEHLHQPAVGVVGEARVAGELRPAARATSSFSPMLRTVSIMPGIENFAPERQETSSGSLRIAEPLAGRAFQRFHGREHLLPHPGGKRPPAARNALQAWW